MTVFPWSVPTLPVPGELMSSFLVRAALAQGCSPAALTDDLWPRWRCWTRDVDRGPGDERMERLRRRSGVSPDALEATTLRDLGQRVAGRRLPRTGRWPWITTLGTRGAKRRGGLQCCPTCLAEDDRPHYRLEWRLGWNTACAHHGTLLIERCPHCDSVLAPHRLQPGDGHVGRCGRCRTDLRDAGAPKAPTDAIAFQRRVGEVLLAEDAVFLGTRVTRPRWFVAAVFLTGLVRAGSRQEETGSARRLLEALEIPMPERRRIEHGIELESMGDESRGAILCSTWRLLGTDAKDLERAMVDARMTHQALEAIAKPVPAPIRALATRLPNRPAKRRSPPDPRSGPRTRREIDAMMARIERRLSMAGS